MSDEPRFATGGIVPRMGEVRLAHGLSTGATMLLRELPRFPSASDEVGPGAPVVPDRVEDLEALRRVSDAALGEELMRRRDVRERA